MSGNIILFFRYVQILWERLLQPLQFPALTTLNCDRGVKLEKLYLANGHVVTNQRTPEGRQDLINRLATAKDEVKVYCKKLEVAAWKKH